AVFRSELGRIEKLLALALLDHWSRAASEPFPSIARLAEWTSCDRRTVMRALRSLEESEVIRVRRRNGLSSTYELGNLPRLPVSESHRCQKATGDNATPPPVSECPPTGVRKSPVPVSECPPKEPKEGTQGRNPGKGERATSPPMKGARKREAPIPTDWQPTEAHRSLASKHGLDVELEALGFRGYFEGKLVASPNGRFTTWLTNQAKWNRQRGTGGRTQP